MLDLITINARINAMEALIIRNEATFKSAIYRSNEMFTNELKNKGISEITVWVNLKSMFHDPLENRNCTINATLRAKSPQNDGFDFISMIDIIEAHLPMHRIISLDEKRKAGLEWKVQSASFSYTFTGLHIKPYFGFLKSGFDLKNMKMEKKVEKLAWNESEEKKKPKDWEAYKLSFASVHKRDVDNGGVFIEQKSHSEIREATKAYNKLTKEEKKTERLRRRRETRKIYDSLSLTVDYDYSPPEGFDAAYYGQENIKCVTAKPKSHYLRIKIGLRKAKIQPLCKDYGIEDRNIEQFGAVAKQIDADVFDFYIGHIVGDGDHYRVADADAIIRESDYTPMKKKRMMDAMRGIALYKGIDNFLNHAEDEKVTSPYMESIRKRAYALEAVRDLQRLGINPVAVRAREPGIFNRLPNLREVYIEKTGIEPGKVRQAKNEIDREKRKQREENKEKSVEIDGIIAEGKEVYEANEFGLAVDKDGKPIPVSTALLFDT